MRVWQERRQPPSISSLSSCRWSAVVTSAAPRITRTLHFPHVPRPPHVESIGSPIQCAALKSVVPGGTRVVRSNGRYLTSSLRWIIPRRLWRPPPPRDRPLSTASRTRHVPKAGHLPAQRA